MAGAYMVHSTHAHTQAMAASMAGQGPGQNGTGGGAGIRPGTRRDEGTKRQANYMYFFS